ncbi:MAG: hypothetical protein ACRDUY_04510 [Nitriliruptorales bacterium]
MTGVSRGVALAAITVACVVVGPAPQLLAAAERIYAVAVVEDESRRRHRRAGGDPNPPGPHGRHPSPNRP